MHSKTNENAVEIPIYTEKRQQINDELKFVYIIIEYQTKKFFLVSTPSPLSKFRAKNWIEKNDQSRGAYNTNNDIRFKTKNYFMW